MYRTVGTILKSNRRIV